MTPGMKDALKMACRRLTLAKGWEILSKEVFKGQDLTPREYALCKRMYYGTFYEALATLSDISGFLTADEATRKLGELMDESKEYSFRNKEVPT